MISKWAKIFGVGFIILGTLGFIPGVTTPDGYLFGIFHVNAAHNVFHIITGIAFLGFGTTSEKASKGAFQVFTVIYGLLAVLGLFYGPSPLFGIIANNVADTWFHVAVTLGSAYLGFIAKPAPEHRTPYGRTRTSHPSR